MIIETDVKYDFSDVLIRPKRSTLSSRSEVDINRTFQSPHTKKTWTNVPVIAANMDTTGTFAMAASLGKYDCLTALHKHYTVAQLNHFYRTYPQLTDKVFYSLGLNSNDFDKLKSFIDVYGCPPNICIDVANGYTEKFADLVKRVRDLCPSAWIMAGNVVTGEMTERLIQAGADIVKVGIGPGSVCTTRRMTGVGYPQLSAIIECQDAAHGFHIDGIGGMICADGGCTVPGDVSKAFGAGADFVMLGGMFSGHTECNGDIVKKDGTPIDPYYEGEKFMQFYGMSSDTAMEKYSGGVAKYRASEGKTVMVPYKGHVDGTIESILGGVRSTMTYIGARKLKQMAKCTTFIKVNRQLNEVFTGMEKR
jgi:GMP reductase